MAAVEQLKDRTPPNESMVIKSKEFPALTPKSFQFTDPSFSVDQPTKTPGFNVVLK